MLLVERITYNTQQLMPQGNWAVKNEEWSSCRKNEQKKMNMNYITIWMLLHGIFHVVFFFFFLYFSSFFGLCSTSRTIKSPIQTSSIELMRIKSTHTHLYAMYDNLLFYAPRLSIYLVNRTKLRSKMLATICLSYWTHFFFRWVRFTVYLDWINMQKQSSNCKTLFEFEAERTHRRGVRAR